MNVNVCTRVRVLHYTICLRSSVNNSTCLLGDAILRIPRDPRDMRVSAHIARGIRMMASFRRLQKGSHIATPVILSSVVWWATPSYVSRVTRVSAHIARGIRMMASFRRLQKGNHIATPVILSSVRGIR